MKKPPILYGSIRFHLTQGGKWAANQTQLALALALDWSHGHMGVYRCQTLSGCTFKMCALGFGFTNTYSMRWEERIIPQDSVWIEFYHFLVLSEIFFLFVSSALREA